MIQRRHFHTFDALRFFACFKVFIHHLPITSFTWFNVISKGGGIGVQFFFVLSGFLITYILLYEKNSSGTIELKKFYKRRVLRIWPLFYLMIAVAFCTPYILKYVLNLSSSDEGYQPNWIMSLLFLENYQMMIKDSFPNVSPLRVVWSVCIEEHFYIIWGLLFYFIKKTFLPFILITSILLGIIFRLIYSLIDLPFLDVFTSIDLFAVGALPAYLLVFKDSFIYKINNIFNYHTKLIFSILLISFIFYLPHIQENYFLKFFTPTILGILFSFLIIFIIPENNKFKINNNNIFSKLGIYTYGFYLYHTIVINLFIHIFIKLNWNLSNAFYAFLFFCITLICSLICSKISYDYFERFFLKLK